MRLYRIGPEQHLSDLSGMGASYQDGARWNRAGQPVIYMSFSPAVAMLELANYLPNPRLVPKSYRLATFELPEGVGLDKVSFADLPANWADFPHPAAVQKIGGDWLSAMSNLVLSVPSSAVAGGLESIALLNPRHTDIAKLSLTDVTGEIYNPRAFIGV